MDFSDLYPQTTEQLKNSVPVFTEDQEELIKSLEQTIDNLKKELAFKNWSERKEI